MKNAIEVRDLVVRRGGREVLKAIGFTIEVGSVTGLLGPSGCGKSTLMRSLVGVQQLTSGSVTAFGEVAGGKALRSRIGYVTQAASVYDDLTVAENLKFFAKVLGVERRQGRRGHRRGRPPESGRPGGRPAQRRAAEPGEPGRRAARRPRPAGPRRAHRGPRPRAEARPLEAVPRDRGAGGRGVRLQPRDGRGRPVRPAAVDARGRDHRRRHPGAHPREDPHRRHRERVPGARGRDRRRKA